MGDLKEDAPSGVIRNLGTNVLNEYHEKILPTSCDTVVAFPFATCFANNYFQKFFFFALTSSQLFSLSLGRFCNFSTFSFW